MIVKTNSLEFDDRIRKVSLALSKDADVKIFALLNDNTEKDDITSYRIHYHSFSLRSRALFPSKKLLLLKTLEFYLKVIMHVRKYDVLWANDENTFLFPLFAKKNKTVWDLHEIPELFLNNKCKWIFHYIERKSLKILHANPFRLDYLYEQGVISDKSKHSYIRNYPDHIFLEKCIESPVYERFIKWLKGEKYVYIQGVEQKDRYPFNSIACVLDATNYKVVIIGGLDSDEKVELEKKYGDKFKERVFLAGWTNQLSLSLYLKDAIFTVILYTKDTPNNRYCEANRFYQACSLAIPIICGSNESMKSIVDEFKMGVYLESDGRDLHELIGAVKMVDSNYSLYKDNSIQCRKMFIWDENRVKKEWWDK